MSGTLIAIQQGNPTVVQTSVTFIGTGSAGDPAACSRLVFPTTVSPLLAPIVYAVGQDGLCFNPTRRLNFDKVPLPHPETSVVRTLGGTNVVRFEGLTEDVVVTEVWSNQAGASMPTFLLRLFYEYLINAALIDPATDDPIVWEPRNQSDNTYQVELLSLSVGGGTGESQFDVLDVRPDYGVVGDFDNALTTLNTTPTGLVDEEVRLRMRILAQVV